MANAAAAMGPTAQADAPPGTGARSDRAGKDAREVALVGKAAVQRHLGKGDGVIEQQLLGPLNPVFQQPAVRRLARALLEGAREMTDRQTALAGNEGKRDLAAQMGAHQLLGASFLPRRQTASG